MLLGFVVLIIGITLYQEHKTERALEALRDLSSPRALVIRDGRQRRIPGRDVVRGDLVLLAEGDRVPADAVRSLGDQPRRRRIAAHRRIGPRAQDRRGRDAPAMAAPGRRRPARSSTRARCWSAATASPQVRATGSGTELGRIGKALEAVEPEQTPIAGRDSRESCASGRRRHRPLRRAWSSSTA